MKKHLRAAVTLRRAMNRIRNILTIPTLKIREVVSKRCDLRSWYKYQRIKNVRCLALIYSGFIKCKILLHMNDTNTKLIDMAIMFHIFNF